MDIKKLNEEVTKLLKEDYDDYDDYEDSDFMSWSDFESEVAEYVLDKNPNLKIAEIESYLAKNSEKIVNKLIKKNAYTKLIELWDECPEGNKEIYNAMRKDIIAFIPKDEAIQVLIEDELDE